jgi:pilus assembly protein CpaB
MAGLKIKNKAKKLRINKNWLMLGLAIVIGVIGVKGADAFIQKQLAAYKEKNNKPVEMVQVVVPKRDMQPGERITVDDLSVRKVPAEYVDKGAVSPDKYQTAIGQSLSYPVYTGMPLLWAHLESGEAGTFAGTLPEGKRAMSFSVDVINSISGFLEPRDKIDLFLTYKLGKQMVTRPLIQNLLVLATDKKTQTDKLGGGEGETNSYNTLTVEVTPEQAEKIVLAQDTGKLTAALRHPEDKKPVAKTAMTVARLFHDNSKKHARKRQRTGIEFIIGGISQ